MRGNAFFGLISVAISPASQAEASQRQWVERRKEDLDLCYPYPESWGGAKGESEKQHGTDAIL